MDTPPGPERICRVLLVDDDLVQLKLNRVRLEEAGFVVQIAQNAEEALAVALRTPPNAIMSDVLMGDLDGFGFCLKVRETVELTGIPVILLSAHYGGPADQELARRVGAVALVGRTADFSGELEVLRASLGGGALPTAFARFDALYEQHLRSSANQISRLLVQAQSAAEKYRILFEHAHDAISLLTPEGVILEANERWRSLIGIDPARMIGRHIHDFAAPGAEVANDEGYQFGVAEGSTLQTEVPLRHADGRTIYMDFSVSVLEIGGEPMVFSIGRDVTEQVEAKRALSAAEERYRTLVERLPDVIWTSRPDGSITFVTPNVINVLGRSPQEIYDEDLQARADAVHPDDRERMLEAFRGISEGRIFDVEYRRWRPDGQWIWVRNRATATYERGGERYIDGMLSDITDRRRLEDSFHQAQKMEAIGHLTGGIAHDFNNMLAAIMANSHFLVDDLGLSDPRRVDALEIKAAAERAASLTRQLLAFSRRQVLEPSIVDLNETVTGIEKMLRRLIGEDVSVSLLLQENLGMVRVDVGQIEQVIMNLVVNARDAMPTGGKLTIETANVELDHEQASTHTPQPAGLYIMVAVSDTGCGMSPEIQAHIFEPFFTTKGPGKGTGLGLSTCYGIVKQSGGFIWVYSETGRGTTFKIYLPRMDAVPELSSRRPAPVRVGGSETILLIEDDSHVRAAVSRILETRGYKLLLASNGQEALALADAHQGAIHVIVSDVVMPGTNGPEVVEQIRERHGAVKALFMSGYTDHAALTAGVLQAGLSFIQKPFAPGALARKLRDILDS